VTDDLPPTGDEPEKQSPDAFVDGRTDYEKLVELLTFPEGPHLDFKAELDIVSTEAKVKFVKDVVAMSNCPPGGYILIGVDNAGNPRMPIGTINRASFDGARLGDLVRGFIEGRVDLRVAIHDHGEHEVVLIFVLPHADGLPVPMSKVGNYPDPRDPSRQLTAFREGELPVREGPANVPLRRSHWPTILAKYTRQVRSEGTELAQAMLREFLDERTQSRAESSAGKADIPLLVDMDEATFAEAMQTLLESDGDVRLRRFLKTVMKSINSVIGIEDFLWALDKWTVFCAQALFAERADLVATAIEMLHDMYAELGVGADTTRKRLEVVIRIYALGSTAVRQSEWETVHALALQPVPSTPHDTRYIYSSWIRHGQVEASRSHLIPDDRGGFLISAARELLVEHPAMRPDVKDDEIPASEDLAGDDILLNSICQFDIAYCFVVAAEGQHRAGYYPSSAALKDYRSAPMAQRIAAKADVRAGLFPDSDDVGIARALADVYESASNESAKYMMWWDMPYAARQFVEQHGSL
jgi:hypothetical protein